MELFILRMTPYREKDFIITAISPEGLVVFKAVGLAKPNAKLSGIVTLYAIVEAELDEKKTGLVLTNALAVSRYYKIMSDYQKLSVLNFIGESTLRLLHDESEIASSYPYIKKAVLGLETAFSPLTLAYITLAKILQAGGYGLDVNRCVYCQSTNDIVGINYVQGGFLCRKHIGHDFDVVLTPEKLNIIRYAFLVPLEKVDKIAFENDVLIDLMQALIIYYQDNASMMLKSAKLLIQSFTQQH